MYWACGFDTGDPFLHLCDMWLSICSIITITLFVRSYSLVKEERFILVYLLQSNSQYPQ